MRSSPPSSFDLYDFQNRPTACPITMWRRLQKIAFDFIMLHRNTEECVPSRYGSVLTSPTHPRSPQGTVWYFSNKIIRIPGTLMSQSLEMACELFVTLVRHLLLYHSGHAIVRAFRCLIALRLHDITRHWQHNNQVQAGDRMQDATFSSLCDQISLHHSLKYVAMST